MCGYRDFPHLVWCSFEYMRIYLICSVHVHGFLSHHALASLRLRVVFFATNTSTFPNYSCTFACAGLTTSRSRACERASATKYHVFAHPETSQIKTRHFESGQKVETFAFFSSGIVLISKGSFSASLPLANWFPDSCTITFPGACPPRERHQR